MPRIAIVGCGVTGTRVARTLLRADPSTDLLLIDRDIDAASALGRSLDVHAPFGSSIAGDATIDVTVLAAAAGIHEPIAEECLGLGHDVVSVSDSLDDIDALLALDAHAVSAGRRLVVGAGMMPGLSDVLAKHGAAWFDQLREIHVSKFGTGGPDCARQHHRALAGMCIDWRNGWQRRPGGSGRELSWFPAPVQASDCYRARLGDPRLLLRANPEVERITARMAATRRDRMTMHLPMLRRPHPEGLLGAVRVELRGLVAGAQTEVVLGCSERPATAAASVAAATTRMLLDQDTAPGAYGLAELVDPIPFLHQLRSSGLRPEIFVGSSRTF